MDWTPDRIAALRKRLGLTQTAFAAALGFTSGGKRVSELEKGTRHAAGPVVQVLNHLDANGLLPSQKDSHSE